MAGPDSFIPAQVGARPVKVKKKRRLYIVNYFLGTAFFVVCALAVVAFVYKERTDSVLTALIADIQEIGSLYDRDDQRPILEQERALNLVRYVLDNQPLVRQLLIVLEQATAHKVQLTGFSLEVSEDNANFNQGNNKKDKDNQTKPTGSIINVSFRGLTDSFDTLLAQKRNMVGLLPEGDSKPQSQLNEYPHLLRNAVITDIQYAPINPGSSDLTPPLSYNVSLKVRTSDIPFTPPTSSGQSSLDDFNFFNQEEESFTEESFYEGSDGDQTTGFNEDFEENFEENFEGDLFFTDEESEEGFGEVPPLP